MLCQRYSGAASKMKSHKNGLLSVAFDLDLFLPLEPIRIMFVRRLKSLKCDRFPRVFEEVPPREELPIPMKLDLALGLA